MCTKKMYTPPNIYIYKIPKCVYIHTHTKNTYIPKLYIYIYMCTHAYNYSPFIPPLIHQKDPAECPFHKLFYLMKHSDLQMTSFNEHNLVLSQGTMK